MAKNKSQKSASLTKSSDRFSILLVEDHHLMREGIKRLISDDGRFRVEAEAGTLKEARRLLAEKRFDLVLLDISLPDGFGLSLLDELRQEDPEARIIVLTMHNESLYLSKAIGLGADGYVVKDMSPERLIHALQSVMAGEKCFFMTDKTSTSSRTPRGFEAEVMDPSPALLETESQALSVREQEVMRMLVSGQTLTEIAEILDLSVKTVFTYRVRLLKKLGLKNNAELIRYSRFSRPRV